METILVVEDDATLLRGLSDNLRYEGYSVLTAADGEAGLEAALNKRPDLVLLDIMLPGINGYEICRLLRREKLAMPILMLTAKGQESDIVLGLRLGADDYITKPFGLKELLARVDAALRRGRSTRSQVRTFGACTFDSEAHVLTRDGVPVHLSPKEHRLLDYFLENAGRALSRDQIMNQVWGYDCMVVSRTIDRFVNTLRAKVEPDPRHPSRIHTVREFGYRFTADPEP